MEAKLFAHPMKAGDKVLATVQDGRQLAGIVEKVESDLANGFVSNVTIVGTIVVP